VSTLSEDREAIRDLYARYTLYLRIGAVDEWILLFTDDPEFTGGGPDIVGRSALEENGRVWATQPVHRMIGSHVIDVDGDTAHCRASVVVYSGFAIVSVGSTSDELRRVDGSWRIHRRSYTPDA
jgi:hypothetical protein